MQEPESTPFPKRGRDLLDTASRLMWRRLHPERRAPEAEIHASMRGPYETWYEIAHGYTGERAITQP